MYARGILFGKMKFELGDHSYVRCPDLGLVADIEFKTKGYFGGTYNAIGGFIKDANDNNLYELSGHWNSEMYIKDLTVRTKLAYWFRSSLNIRLDWPKGVALQCNKCEANSVQNQTT
jgi:Oxysterol-binding protein